MKGKTLFIADLHLTEHHPLDISRFVRFLDTHSPQLRALFILGDLFDLWVGDDHLPPALHEAVKALKLHGQRFPIYIMRGNRDFLLRDRFQELSGCTLIPDPYLTEIGGITTLLTHGDTLCANDEEYLRFYQKVRTPQWQQAFLSQPLCQRLVYGRQVRSESKEKAAHKTRRHLDIDQRCVDDLMRRHQTQQMIHGHLHREGRYPFVLDKKPALRLALGDWQSHGSVLEYTECGFHFHSEHLG